MSILKWVLIAIGFVHLLRMLLMVGVVLITELCREVTACWAPCGSIFRRIMTAVGGSARAGRKLQIQLKKAWEELVPPPVSRLECPGEKKEWFLILAGNLSRRFPSGGIRRLDGEVLSNPRFTRRGIRSAAAQTHPMLPSAPRRFPPQSRPGPGGCRIPRALRLGARIRRATPCPAQSARRT